MPQVAAPPVRADGLQLNENRSYQERFWAVERWAWLAFVAITLAAALGATGAGGPLSRAVSVTAGGEIEVPRIARWQAADTMTVRFLADGGSHSLRLSPAFARHFQTEAIQPQPQRVVMSAGGQTIYFNGGKAPSEAVLYLRPQLPGLVRFSASIDEGTAADLSTLVLP